ncbi:MAG: radical SAM protein [Deltaproteobacteria bacterium]|nr:radical SAM protein [Deltaproteobacteria bacterium]
MSLLDPYENCRLCPRNCGVNRVYGGAKTRMGFCGETYQLRVAYVGPHFGEEPPITGNKGSGGVFFSGCSLKCSYCQNQQISHHGLGRIMSLEKLLEIVEYMILKDRVHNINFVTPDHFFPHVFDLITILRQKGLDLPIVLNLSGYQSVEVLKVAADYAGIYLPDFKYSDSFLAGRLSKCPDYPGVALEAIAEMVLQKGFLDACLTGSGIAKRGVLVRHLILPGNVENSITALTTLFVEFGKGLPLSLMSQYHPAAYQKDEDLNRFVSEDEFDSVYSHAIELGFEHLFVQFPDKDPGLRPQRSSFFPDFRQPDPFKL